MRSPTLPFEGYKWRWAAVECTEGLNEPPVFLGVLRAMRKYEGRAPSDARFINALQEVKNNTRTRIDLARTPQRNLVRNSGQYWKAFDLLRDTRGAISLTPFGRKIADGKITQTEFATTIVKTLQLPNPRIESDTSRWQSAGLTIKPLELILKILGELKKSGGPQQAYLTRGELVGIVIPLAGEQSPVSKHVRAVRMFRTGQLDLSGWPDCAPSANDKRIAGEFLLFLNHYGFCHRQKGRTNDEDKYELAMLEPGEIKELVDLDTQGLTSTRAFQKIANTQLPAVGERRRAMMQVLERPQQAKFRRDVLIASQTTCLVTGVRLSAVLEAAHIIPVKRKGTDNVDNGICLRADIHLLFDTGHLRIQPNGHTHLSNSASRVALYRSLPSRVTIPPFVKIGNLKWRWNLGEF